MFFIAVLYFFVFQSAIATIHFISLHFICSLSNAQRESSINLCHAHKTRDFSFYDLTSTNIKACHRILSPLGHKNLRGTFTSFIVQSVAQTAAASSLKPAVPNFSEDNLNNPPLVNVTNL